MKGCFCALFLLCLLSAAQDQKPDAKTKARELLDGAVEMLPAATAEIQASGLYHAADNYRLLDSRKALDLARQAFAAAGALPEQHSAVFREGLMADIAIMTTEIDVDAAAEMLRVIPPKTKEWDRRWMVIEKLADKYLEKEQFDAAIELVDSYGSAGSYAFTAAGRIIRKLPAADSRRGAVFSAALSGYKVHPHESYVRMLATTWKEVPRPLAATAVDALMSEILNRKQEGDYQRWGFVTEKGITVFDTPEEASLFDVLYIVEEINPKRAAEILEKYPTLRGVHEQFPMGTKSMEGKGAFWTFVVTGDDKNAVDRLTGQQRAQMLVENRATVALNAAEESAERGLEMVKNIPNLKRQAEVLGSIARLVASKEPEKAGPLLGKCMKAVEELKDPGERGAAWDALAESAHLAKDPKIVEQVLDRALADAAELAKRDAGAPLPNAVLREHWPSTQAYRRVVMRATAIHGVDAEPFLLKIADTDIQMLARISMAQSLLGRMEARWTVYPPRKPKQ